MVDITLSESEIDNLSSMIGDNFVSLECEGLHQDFTYAYALFQTNNHRLEVSNVQEAIAQFDLFGDFPILKCHLLSKEDSFEPFVNTIPQKYPLRGRIVSVDVVNDTINIPDCAQSLCRTQSIIFHTDKNSVTISVGPLFSEHIAIHANTKTVIPSVKEIEETWKEYPNDEIQVLRGITHLE